MVQVAEWQNNMAIPETQMKVLMDIGQELLEAGVSNSEIYWSVENNTLGEACLVVIREIGEEKSFVYGVKQFSQFK